MNLRQYLLLSAFVLLLVVYASSPTNAMWSKRRSAPKAPKEKKVNLDNFWHPHHRYAEKYPPPRTDQGVKRLMRKVRNDDSFQRLDRIPVRKYIPYPNRVPSENGWGNERDAITLCRLHMRAEMTGQHQTANQVRRIMNYIRGDDLETEIPHVYEKDPYAEEATPHVQEEPTYYQEEPTQYQKEPVQPPSPPPPRSPTTVYYTTDSDTWSTHSSMPSLETASDTEGPGYAYHNYFQQGYSQGYNHGLYGQYSNPGSRDLSYMQGYQQGYNQGYHARYTQGSNQDTSYWNNNEGNDYSLSTNNNNGGSYGNTAPDTSYWNNNEGNDYSLSTSNNNGGSYGNTAPAPPPKYR